MNFEVTYRAKDGRRVRECFEAEDRAALFAMLSSRGITAIKAEALTGAPARRGWRIPAKAWVMAASIATVIAVVAFLLVREKVDADEAEDANKSKKPLPSVQTPATKPSIENPPGDRKPSEKEVAKEKRPYPIHVDEFGVRRYPNGVRVFDEKTPMRPAVTPFGDKPIFNNKCLNELSTFIHLRPGDALFGTRKYDARYLENLRKGLEEKIEITEDDDENTRAAKLEMIEVQKELRRMGDDEILSMVKDTYSELQRLARYKAHVQYMVKEALSTRDDLTDQDYADIIGAANRMLAKEGIAPIRNTFLVRKNIKFNNLKNMKKEEVKQ